MTMPANAIVYPMMKPKNVCELCSQYVVGESCNPLGGHFIDDLILLSISNAQYVIVYPRVNSRYAQSIHNLSLIHI